MIARRAVGRVARCREHMGPCAQQLVRVRDRVRVRVRVGVRVRVRVRVSG